MSLKVLVICCLLVVFIGASPVDINVETTTTATEFEIDVGEPSEPFNPEQYKEYLLNLTCSDIIINHGGIKIPEIESGTIYIATTTKQPKPAKYGGLQEEEEAVADYDIDDLGTRKSKGSTGSSEANSTTEAEPCTAPLSDKWNSYDWYQILVDNGGAPGKINATGAKPNLTKATDPCARPLEFESAQQDKVWYITKSVQSEKRVYRDEKVSLRFPDTGHEFLDVKGVLVWSPPEERHRSYHIGYRKDDTGFYVHLDREQRCRFTDPRYTSGIICENTGSIECICEFGREVCKDLSEEPIGLSPGLIAGLVGK